MNRTRVALLVTGLAACSMLVACGGVDRDGSVDNFVKSFAESGVEVDPDCVREVFDQYDDDALKEIPNDELTAEVAAACAGG